jgi:hypothetical protein
MLKNITEQAKHVSLSVAASSIFNKLLYSFNKLSSLTTRRPTSRYESVNVAQVFKGREVLAHAILVWNIKGRTHLEDLGVDGRVVNMVRNLRFP